MYIRGYILALNNKTNIHEIDHEGMETLAVVSEAQQLNRWMYKTIEPFCTGKILEIGSGIGNISSFFIHDNHEIYLSDLLQIDLTSRQK